jgi:membrane fusion protein (multidrug efflux system)
MRILPWLITATGCLGVTAALAGIKYNQIQSAMAMASSFPPPSEVVAATRVSAEQWTPVRRLTGTVRAPEFVRIAVEAAGRVVSLPHAAGDQVAAGDVILQLFDEDLQAQREAQRADLALVETQLKRVQELKRDALASQDQLDTLLARAQALRAQISAIEAQISRLTVRAPFAGRLGIYSQTVGDLMQAGKLLTTLTGLSGQRWIDFKVPQGLAEVVLGDTVRLLGIDGQLIGNAQIIAVSDAYNSAIRAYDVRAVIDDNRLRHGEMLQVEVQAGRGREALRVPNQAVRWDVEGPHVFALVKAPEDSHTPWVAELRRVALLDERDGIALISGELQPGEQVAAAGAFKLSEAMPVIIAEGGSGL